MGYAIDQYALRWRKAGHRVRYHVGPDCVPASDVLIVHVDRTRVPESYHPLIQQHPCVINGRILDSSRRRFSELLLSQDSSYDGPVIVKTNANFGAIPEYGDSKATRGWSSVKSLPPTAYPIFPSRRDVPEEIWGNPHLVVERFVGDRRDELFRLNYYVFFGTREYGGQLSSRSPIVKFGNAIDDTEYEPPAKVKSVRKKLGVDFGRIDYVLDEGVPRVIDVNKTEGGGQACFDYPEFMDMMAAGLDDFIGMRRS
ncbi:MAG: hypothetical protein AAGA55_07865 [Planctomycetota bacterium]